MTNPTSVPERRIFHASTCIVLINDSFTTMRHPTTRCLLAFYTILTFFVLCCVFSSFFTIDFPLSQSACLDLACTCALQATAGRIGRVHASHATPSQLRSVRVALLCVFIVSLRTAIVSVRSCAWCLALTLACQTVANPTETDRDIDTGWIGEER